MATETLLAVSALSCASPVELPPSRLVVCLPADTVWVYGQFSEKDSTPMVSQDCF